MKQFTTGGVTIISEIEPGYQTGPSISDHERDRRLMLMRMMKGKSEKAQQRIYERLKKEGKL